MSPTYEPPNGIENFVRVLQRCSAADAVNLLALAFNNCAADAVTQDMRLRFAAPQLLAACKLALRATERHEAIDWTELVTAIEKAERIEAPIA